jgi:hypothetical protein
MQDQSTENKNIFKQWLEKLQQESWQLELLISGFALFGIYSARTLITDLEFYRELELTGDIRGIAAIFILIFKMGWLIFFINLVVHVILRGLWIGAIGLRYVSNEINFKELNYSPRFENYLVKKIGSYDDFIERLEKICSVLFAFTFLLFLLFMSLMIFVLQVVFIAITMGKYVKDNSSLPPIIGILMLVYIFMGIIVFIDLVTLGGLKKINQKHISKIYFYIYRYISIVTLSFLYRPLLYNFIDNKYTKKLFYLAIPYIFIVTIGHTMFENTFNPYETSSELNEDLGVGIDIYLYDDLRNQYLAEFPNEERKVKKQQLRWVSLEHMYISSDVSSVFFKTNDSQVRLLEKDSSIAAYKTRGLRFSWFGLNKKDDPIIEKFDEEKEKTMLALIKYKKEIKKKYADQKNILDVKLDSIQKIITEKEQEFAIKRTQIKGDKVLKIKEKLASNFQLYIDTVKIDLDQCFYFTHPHYQEQGIKCFFRTDSLSKGPHSLKIVRNFLDKDEPEIEKDSLILPIIKQ